MALNAQQAAYLEQILSVCYDRPDLFVKEVLGGQPSEHQLSGLMEIAKPGAKITIRSGHNTGKTTLLAWVILWYVVTRYDCKIPCTAPTASQLRDALWPELHKWRGKMPPELSDEIEITQERVSIKSGPHLQFAVARTSRKENPEALQGFHATNLMFVLDEASGIDEVIFEVARGALSNPGARILMASNPTRTHGYFYDSHNAHRDRWTCLHWSCLESPFPDPKYAVEVAEDYGEDSNFYRVRVLGDFPAQESDQFIALELLEAASLRDNVIADGPVIWGLDPAWLGNDETVLCKRQGDVVLSIQGRYGLDTMQTSGWIANEYDDAGIKPQTIVVDTIGIGAGVFDRLKELNYPVMGCNVAESPSVNGKFINKRAELWQEYRDWLEARRGKIPNDGKLIGQSSCVKYGFASSGKLQIESKADMRKRGIHSPDRADAVILTFYAKPLLKHIQPAQPYTPPAFTGDTSWMGS